jgi:aryl-alcohol dehydrogenase (NADP+)
MGFGSKAWREWVLDETAARSIVRRALDAGITFFDTCDYYSGGVSEEILGRTLLADVKRDEVVVATKVGMPMGRGANSGGFSRKHLFAAVDASLRRLGTDYIDLYQTHIWDESANLEEMMCAFHDLVRSGKVLYVGATDMPAWQLAKALHLCEVNRWTRFVSMQNHYNLIFREHERELLPLCRAEGLGLIPYSPIGRGFLAGNRRREGFGDTLRAKTDDFAQKLFYRDADFEAAKRVGEVAAKLGCRPAQIALAWVLSKPAIVSPIFGATSIAQVDECVQALTIELGADDRRHLEAAYSPHPLPAG